METETETETESDPSDTYIENKNIKIFIKYYNKYYYEKPKLKRLDRMLYLKMRYNKIMNENFT